MKQKYNPEKQLEYRKKKRVTTIVDFGCNGCYAVCPMCNRLLDREYMNFCDCCGQNLSWRKFNKVKIVKWEDRKK